MWALASEKCQQEKRKTVNGEDILFAMTSTGFENYAEALKIYLAKYREVSNIFHGLTFPAPSCFYNISHQHKCKGQREVLITISSPNLREETLSSRGQAVAMVALVPDRLVLADLLRVVLQIRRHHQRIKVKKAASTA